MREASKPDKAAPAESETATPVDEAARKRVAVEMLSRHERMLRKTARRYSICAEDADDAFQRALEILLLKAPQGNARELVRWMQTVTKHEALAVRRGRERQMGPAPRPTDETEDWVAQIPSRGVGPAERAERRESIARSREALQALKPQELRALTLLAEGYSYAEIGDLTGYSKTKINRCLAEGRERYRAIIARSESGGRCAELRPSLSAFCDGEASPDETAVLREHLRACGQCRAALRAYRAAPGAAAALLPMPVAAPTLLERAQSVLADLHERIAGRLPGGGSDTATQLATSGGASGLGLAGAAKLAAICVGAAGGAAACVSAGVVPSPLDRVGQDSAAPAAIKPIADTGSDETVEPVVAPTPEAAPEPSSAPKRNSPVAAEQSEAVTNGGVEFTPSESVSSSPPPPPVTAPEAPPSEPAPEATGNSAGEFGP